MAWNKFIKELNWFMPDQQRNLSTIRISIESFREQNRSTYGIIDLERAHNMLLER